jgi:hypothetical protein
MPSAISRLRALIHYVLLCSLLTTWLVKPVDVVASLGTHIALVCSYPQRPAHPGNQTAAAFGVNIERNALLAKFEAKFEKCKVCKFEVFVFAFRDSQKVNFSDFAFFDFSTR